MSFLATHQLITDADLVRAYVKINYLYERLKRKSTTLSNYDLYKEVIKTQNEVIRIFSKERTPNSRANLEQMVLNNLYIKKKTTDLFTSKPIFQAIAILTILKKVN